MLRKQKIKINRYARLRNLDEISLLKAYEEADPSLKDVYDSEMELYFGAIKSKDIKKGQSILHIYDPAPEGNN